MRPVRHRNSHALTATGRSARSAPPASRPPPRRRSTARYDLPCQVRSATGTPPDACIASARAPRLHPRALELVGVHVGVLDQARARLGAGAHRLLDPRFEAPASAPRRRRLPRACGPSTGASEGCHAAVELPGKQRRDARMAGPRLLAGRNAGPVREAHEECHAGKRAPGGTRRSRAACGRSARAAERRSSRRRHPTCACRPRGARGRR